MSVVWYRVCFDPRPTRERFKDSNEFDIWLAKHFAGIDFRNAGFVDCPHHETLNTHGTPLWNIIVPGGGSDIIQFLSEQDWVIDDFDTILYVRCYDESEEKVHRS